MVTFNKKKSEEFLSRKFIIQDCTWTRHVSGAPPQWMYPDSGPNLPPALLLLRALWSGAVHPGYGLGTPRNEAMYYPYLWGVGLLGQTAQG